MSEIAVVQSDERTRRLLERSLVGTGATIRSFPSDEARVVHTMSVDILFVDWPNVDVVGPVLVHNPAAHVVLMADRGVFEERGRDIMELPLSNLLITNLSADDLTAVQELVVTTGKLLSGNIFGLDKYLAWGSAIRNARVTSSAQRSEIIDAIRDYSERCGLQSNRLRRVETLAEELITNAIWNAPVDESGKRKYEQPGGPPIELAEDDQPIIQWGSDGTRLGISVTDRFGRLEGDRAFEYLVKCFAKGADQLDKKEGGAGLGLYMAYMAVSTLVINVDPGRRTEVIGLVDLHRSAKDARSFQYFRHG